MTFSASHLIPISDSRQVHIETPGRRPLVPHRDLGCGRRRRGVLSVRCAVKGKWYQRALENLDVVLDATGTKIKARAVPAVDATLVEDQQGLRRNYQKSKSLDFMLEPEILDTNMRLDPW